MEVSKRSDVHGNRLDLFSRSDHPVLEIMGHVYKPGCALVVLEDQSYSFERNRDEKS